MFTVPSSRFCPANIEGWWIFKHEGPHRNVKITSVERFGLREWAKWNVSGKCLDCGARLHEMGVSEPDMIRAGIAIPE